METVIRFRPDLVQMEAIEKLMDVRSINRSEAVRLIINEWLCYTRFVETLNTAPQISPLSVAQAAPQVALSENELAKPTSERDPRSVPGHPGYMTVLDPEHEDYDPTFVPF